jgi:hypothetical protein
VLAVLGRAQGILVAEERLRAGPIGAHGDHFASSVTVRIDAEPVPELQRQLGLARTREAGQDDERFRQQRTEERSQQRQFDDQPGVFDARAERCEGLGPRYVCVG